MVTCQIDMKTGKVFARISPPIETAAPPGVLFKTVDDAALPQEGPIFYDPVSDEFHLGVD